MRQVAQEEQVAGWSPSDRRRVTASFGLKLALNRTNGGSTC